MDAKGVAAVNAAAAVRCAAVAGRRSPVARD